MWSIYNLNTQSHLGSYRGATAIEAFAAMVRAYGYQDYAERLVRERNPDALCGFQIEEGRR